MFEALRYRFRHAIWFLELYTLSSLNSFLIRLGRSPLPGSNNYRYAPLKHDEIRLLELFPGSDDDAINCHLHHFSIQRCGAPEALSYTWGQNSASEVIKVHGRNLAVTPNLHAALKELRREGLPHLPEDASRRVALLWQRFQVLAKSTSPPSFSENGLELISKCYGERVAEFIIISRDPGTQYISPLVESSKGLDRDTLITMIQNRGAESLERLFEEYITPTGRERLANLPRLLWVDAICINQQDMQERAKQISLMRRIYKRAFRLVVWLGRHEDDSPRAVDFIAQVARKQQEGNDTALEWVRSRTSSPDFAATWVSLGRFFGRQWFRRAWVIQEYVAGGKDRAVFCCGQTRLTLLSLENFILVGNELMFRGALDLYIHKFKGILKDREASRDHDLSDHPGYLTESEEVRDVSARKMFEQIAADFIRGMRSLASLRSLRGTFELAEENGIDSRDEHILLWLGRTRITDSSDPRDKVYAVLGLLDDSNKEGQVPITRSKSLIIDYNATVEDVYSSLVRAIVESSERLGILSACTKRSELITRSWTPDWTQYPPDRPLLTTVPVTGRFGAEFGSPTMKFNHSAAGKTDAVVSFSANLSNMTVRGILWDRIEFVSTKIVEGSSSFISPSFEADCRQMIEVLISQKDCTETESKEMMLRALMCCDDESISEGWIPSLQDWLLPHPSDTNFNLDHSAPNPASNWRTSQFLTALLDSLWTDRRIFQTEKGFIGQGPATSTNGDIVCILLGCPVPMVLRVVKNHYELVGEAYMHGIMQGEVIGSLDEGAISSQEFMLQ